MKNYFNFSKFNIAYETDKISGVAITNVFITCEEYFMRFPSLRIVVHKIINHGYE